MVCVGVLALQGDFSKHIEMMKSLDAQVKEVRSVKDLQGCQGLIIPGGESTVMMKLIDEMGLRDALLEFAKNKPIFGTCAGLILMSKSVPNAPFCPLQLMDLEIERNAYGRQIASFEAEIVIEFDNHQPISFPAIFIRAPRIQNHGAFEVLGTYQDEPVLVRQDNFLGASFHPELTNNTAVHEYFLNMIR
ncbi:MAG: pyridoxal 5'-phosphate synthase glutaminase subunit PdxT [Parachlamydiaceae bacterium]|nr:pyridoxal 5'-phosphate synthase glutaminase subunit PdxT [Parachlamydiaceae bacterium]